jgi:hypothetical protein
MKKLFLITLLSLFAINVFATTNDKEVNLTFYPSKKLTPTTASILCSSARNHLSIAATQKLDIEAETPFHCSLGTEDGEQFFLITMITAGA